MAQMETKNGIRILHVFAPNYRQRFGGPIFNWKFYFSHWTDRNIEHYVLDSIRNKIIDANEAFNFSFDGTQRIAARSERIGWVFSLYRNLRKFRNQYDIIHFHLLWWGGLLMAVWANLNNIPTIYESVLEGSDTPSNIRRQSFGAIKLWCLRKFTGILAISDNLGSNYLAYGFPLERVFIQKNCIDTNLFHPIESEKMKIALRQKYTLPMDQKIILFVGSMIKRKGIDLLINGFIESTRTQDNLALLIIGPKDQSENPTIDPSFVYDLVDLIERNQLKDKVILLGMIQDRTKLSELFRAVDIFVLPSRREGLPNVVLEAMASGLPIIVTPLPGLDKVIENMKTGIVVPFEDNSAIKNSIIHLINNPEFGHNLGRSAFQYVQKNHSFTKWQSDMKTVYESIINTSH